MTISVNLGDIPEIICAMMDGSINYYQEDPLWDGQGCSTSSTCCGLNSPPWFCKSLPETTSDDLEIRQCHCSQATHEDSLISLIEIYVK